MITCLHLRSLQHKGRNKKAEISSLKTVEGRRPEGNIARLLGNVSGSTRRHLKAGSNTSNQDTTAPMSGRRFRGSALKRLSQNYGK